MGDRQGDGPGPMADQNRCPALVSDARDGLASLVRAEDFDEMKLRGVLALLDLAVGTGRKEADDGLLTAQGGEGPGSGSGSSPAVSADLIDRAALAAAKWTCWFNGNGWDGLDEAEPEELEKLLDLARGPAEAAVKAVALSLVEHGRQQVEFETRGLVNQAEKCAAALERGRWKARIEELAEAAEDAFAAIEFNQSSVAARQSKAAFRSLLEGENE